MQGGAHLHRAGSQRHGADGGGKIASDRGVPASRSARSRCQRRQNAETRAVGRRGPRPGAPLATCLHEAGSAIRHSRPQTFENDEHVQRNRRAVVALGRFYPKKRPPGAMALANLVGQDALPCLWRAGRGLSPAWKTRWSAKRKPTVGRHLRGTASNALKPAKAKTSPFDRPGGTVWSLPPLNTRPSDPSTRMACPNNIHPCAMPPVWIPERGKGVTFAPAVLPVARSTGSGCLPHDP